MSTSNHKTTFTNSNEKHPICRFRNLSIEQEISSEILGMFPIVI